MQTPTRKIVRVARKNLLDLPNELLLEIAGHFGPGLKDVNSLLCTSRFFAQLLEPVLVKLAVNFVGRGGRSLLHWASSSGHSTLVALLLERGARATIDRPDLQGLTPLHSAALRGQAEAVKILLENGADTETRSKFGWTPLHLATLTGGHIAARLLLENGAEIGSRSPTVHEKTAFHYAALLGHIAVAKLLLEKGVDIEAKDKAGMTAVQNAVVAGHNEMVSLLMDSGAQGLDASHHMCQLAGLEITMARLYVDFYLSHEGLSYIYRF